VVTWPESGLHGLHAKPLRHLEELGYHSPLLRMFDHVVEKQFLKPENRASMLAQDGLLTCCKRSRNGVRRTLRNGPVGYPSISAALPTSSGKLGTRLGVGKVRRGRTTGN
jgi:hypothetical protein